MSYRLLPPGKLTLGESAAVLQMHRATLVKRLQSPEDVPFQVPLRVCFMRVGKFWWGDLAAIAFWLDTNGDEAAWAARCAQRLAASDL